MTASSLNLTSLSIFVTGLHSSNILISPRTSSCISVFTAGSSKIPLNAQGRKYGFALAALTVSYGAMAGATPGRWDALVVPLRILFATVVEDGIPALERRRSSVSVSVVVAPEVLTYVFGSMSVVLSVNARARRYSSWSSYSRLCPSPP